MEYFLLAVLLSVASTVGGHEMDIVHKLEQMLYPSVRIQTGNEGTGSGVVIESNNDYTLILTARHVIDHNKVLTVVTYPDEEEHSALVVKVSLKYDLAIIAIKSSHPYVAKLADLSEYSVFTPVWKVGAGLGLDPHPGDGIITINEEDTMTINAHVIYGDSGGPVFIEDNGKYKLVGIVYSVAIVNPIVPASHIGQAHNLNAVWDFLSHP